MHDELSSISHNDVWDLMEGPVGCKVVGSKWVLKPNIIHMVKLRGTIPN